VWVLVSGGLVRWVTDPNGPVVTVNEQPPDGAGAGWLAPIALGLFLVSVYSVLRRRRRMPGGPMTGLSGLAAGASVGNALLDFGAMLSPDRPDAAVIRRMEEEPLVDEIGDARAPSPRAPP
jgi:hypothetical protein